MIHLVKLRRKRIWDAMHESWKLHAANEAAVPRGILMSSSEGE